MDGIADMGGMHGFGPLERADERGPFHNEWERRILGITFAALGAGLFNVDEIRRTTESADPLTYLKSTYYERWLYSAEDLLKEKGAVTAGELATGRSVTGPANNVPPVTKEIARVILEHGGTSRSADGAPSRFKSGDAVVARNIHPRGHTRLPRYVRGKCGTIVLDHGIFALPDSNSAGLGLQPQHVYGVRFTARELWGPRASERDTLQIDLFDDYLDRLAAPAE
ncbi:MAG TPA: nitrile hydratase subunit beta [Xanthobacteraceae bacterium]|jgi:nitrile hydratase